MKARILLLLLAIPAVVHARAARENDFDVRPAPAWVERVSVDTAVNVPKSDIRYGVYSILDDHQIRVTAAGEETDYSRHVRKVVSPSGVQNASELNIDFDPSYQRLVLHDAAVVRDGKRIEQLDPSEVKVIEKEDESDGGIYDGELTAVIFLEDVRPGDVIDYSYTLDGANPLLAGKYADGYDLTSSIPSRQIRYRLLWPSGRRLQWRAHNGNIQPVVTKSGDTTVIVWERRDAAALDVEDSIPDWYDPWQTVEVTDFGSWHDVATWAVALFQSDDASKTAVHELAQKIEREQKTKADRIVAAIRFVQDDVRYLGIEMGRNSHEPHQPADTLRQRYGDCKDKAFLLASLLRELGVEAYPALVNTSLKRSLDTFLPTPFLFDHVITQVIDGGKTYWIDGTISDQGGTLETIDTPSYERAVVVRPETTGLAQILTRNAGTTRIEQTYTSNDLEEPTALDVTSVYTGRDADDMRSRLSTLSLADVAKENINRYAADHPKIEAKGQPKVVDDRTRNVITLTEHYVVRDLWRRGSWTYYPHVVENHLLRPDTMIRTMPLAFEYPLNVTQVLTFRLPRHLDIDTSKDVTDTPTFHYEYDVDSSGKTVTITHSLRALKDHVPAGDVPDHLTKLNEMWDQIGYTLSPGKAAGAAAPFDAEDVSTLLKFLGALGGVALFVAVVTALAIRRRSRRRAVFVERRRGFRPGEAPASALMVRDSGDLHRHLAALAACSCGASLTQPPELQRARYDEREMTIATRNCTQCGREQSLYFSAA